jgi:hypothetical protein
MCADVTHNEQWCFPHSRLNYGQSSSNKEGPIKLILHKLANQVQQKGKTSGKQVYMLRDKKVLINPTRNIDEQIVIKIGPVGAPIKESERPIVIDNLDQSNMEKISKGADVNNHEAWISTSALENFQPTWCPSGLSRTQKRKLQRARCKKFKEEGLTKMGKQIFKKDPIFPQSSKKELATCSKLAEVTP